MGAKTTSVKTTAEKATPVKKAAVAKKTPAAEVKAAPAPVAAAAPSPAPRSRASDRVMTEAEIMAAPEKDYMNPAQLHFFKVRLQTMEQDILRNAGETTEHLRESIIVPDPADRATIEEEHALELRTRDRERKLLKKIQQSIHRIDSGEYGYCEETGDPIGVPRLLARPTATLSLEAQERREMKQKMFGE
jgi:DnaK suppressor protein